MEGGRERGERERLTCCSTYLCIHWLILVCALTRDQTLAHWDDSVTNGDTWPELLVILICISLITGEAEHLSMYLLAICTSSWEKYRTDTSPFFNWIVYFVVELYEFFIYFRY